MLLTVEHRRVEPAEFQQCVILLTHKIEAVAVRCGVPNAGDLDLEGVLTALPRESRGRVGAMLNGIGAQVTHENRVMAVAARYVRALAADVWNSADRALPDSSLGQQAHSSQH